MSWTTATLGDVVRRDGGMIQTGPFGSQLHQSDYVTEGTPVIMPKDIADGRVDTTSVARVSEETVDRLSRHQLRPRTIVLPRRGEITKRAFVREDQAGWLCGTGCLQIALEGRLLLPEFLYYFMEQHEVARWLEQHAVGTTMLNLSGAIVADVPVRYPTIAAQQRIADTLVAYDDLIENNRRRMALLEEAARQLYREWFVRLRFPGREHTHIAKGVPHGWEARVLGDACEDVRDAAAPDQLEPDTPYVGLEHMPRRSIALAEWGRVEEVTSTKLRFRQGEILFGKIRPYFHKVGIALVDGVASSDAIVIRPRSPDLACLVLCCVSSDPFIAATSQGMKEGSKMPRADWKQMKQYPLPVPPAGLLADFNGVIEPLLAQLRVLVLQSRALRAARDLLLPRLIPGEIET